MAKLSSASIRLVQKLNRKTKDGEYPIYIVICFGGRLERACGVTCLQKHWDAKHEVIKAAAPNAPVLNKMLQDIKGKAMERKNYFEFNKMAYTPSMLLEDVKTDFSGAKNDFKRVMDDLIQERRLKPNTVKNYTNCYKKLKDFLGKDSFIVDELTVGAVREFAEYLDSSDANKKCILSCLASVYNHAITLRLVPRDSYPFDSFKFQRKYKDKNRDYFLTTTHMKMLMDYFMDMVIERNGKRWHYKEGAFERLGLRYTKEFSVMWFLLCYKLNGSAPIEVAFLKTSNCSQITIDGEQYYAIDFKRQKTNAQVHVRLKRDIFAIVAVEHFLGRSTNGMVYPIVTFLEDRQKAIHQSWNVSEICIRHIRSAFEDINQKIAQSNAENHTNEPLVEVNKVVMYTARHSLANHLLDSNNVSVRALASILARSPNTISCYIHSLTQDSEIASVTSNLPI